MGNFFVDKGHITLFDFDDSLYSWFVNDIAIVLFYAVRSWPDDEQSAFAHHFLDHFWQGYTQENQLSRDWLIHIPDFLKLRELDLYAVIHFSFDVNNLDDSPWVAKLMHNRKYRIERDIPYLDDFTALKF